MANKEAPLQTTLVGANPSTGVESFFAQVTSNGGLHSNLRDSSGNETGINTNKLKVETTVADSNQLDAFGRFRTAIPDLIESLHFANTNHPLLMNTALTGSATQAFNANTSSARLTCTTNSTDTVVFQSRRYFRYNPGHGYLVTVSGNLGAKKANTRQRVGYFDANDGLFFEQTSTALSVVVRTNASGSPVDTAVAQTSWNIDKLDGTGTSGINLDTSKHNLYVIDFLWHGAGRIRFGIFYNGAIIYCHQINGANATSVPFMRSPSLPLRAELSNLTTTASTTTMDIVCFAYQKESTDDLIPPYHFSASTGRTAVTATATTLPLISIRPKTTFNSITNRVPVVPDNVSVISNNQPILISVLLNATLTGASFSSANTNSSVEFDIAATAVSGGTIIKQFYLAATTTLLASSTGSIATNVEALILGLDIAGSVQDTVTIAVQSTAGNTTCFGQIDWWEFQ